MKHFKNRSVFTFLLLVLLFGACSGGDQDHEITEDNLPYSVQSFISIHLSAEVPEKIIKLKHTDPDGALYTVEFSSGIIARFDPDGAWQEVRSPYVSLTEIVGSSLLTEEIVGYLRTNFPGAALIRLSNTPYGEKALLSSGERLAFRFGEVAGIDITSDGLQNLPAGICAFLHDHFPKEDAVFIIQSDERVHAIRLTNDCELKFDRFYHWFYIEGEQPLPESLISQLPEKLLTELIPYCEEGEIIGMQLLSPTCYQIQFNNHHSYIHYTDARTIVVPVQAALDFAQQYFNSTASIRHSIFNGPIDYSQPFVFRATVPGGFEFIIDEEEFVRSVTATEASLPDALYDLIPAKAAKYIKTNTDGAMICIDRYVSYGYYIRLAGGEEYKFDLWGEVILE